MHSTHEFGYGERALSQGTCSRPRITRRSEGTTPRFLPLCVEAGGPVVRISACEGLKRERGSVQRPVQPYAGCRGLTPRGEAAAAAAPRLCTAGLLSTILRALYSKPLALRLCGHGVLGNNHEAHTTHHAPLPCTPLNSAPTSLWPAKAPLVVGAPPLSRHCPPPLFRQSLRWHTRRWRATTTR